MDDHNKKYNDMDYQYAGDVRGGALGLVGKSKTLNMQYIQSMVA